MLCNYAKQQALNTLFKGVVYSQPLHLYVGLSTTDLLADASGLTEVTGTNYARVICDAWTVTATGQVSNTNPVSFAQAGATPWGTPIQFFVADALTLGNIIARGPIVYPNTQVVFGSDDAADGIYAPGHTFNNGDQVRFYGFALPTNISGNTSYFVINKNVTGDFFQISLTAGGAAVTGIGDGHGLVGKDFAQAVVLNNTLSFAAGQLVGQIEG